MGVTRGRVTTPGVEQECVTRGRVTTKGVAQECVTRGRVTTPGACTKVIYQEAASKPCGSHRSTLPGHGVTAPGLTQKEYATRARSHSSGAHTGVRYLGPRSHRWSTLPVGGVTVAGVIQVEYNTRRRSHSPSGSRRCVPCRHTVPRSLGNATT